MIVLLISRSVRYRAAAVVARSSPVMESAPRETAGRRGDGGARRPQRRVGAERQRVAKHGADVVGIRQVLQQHQGPRARRREQRPGVDVGPAFGDGETAAWKS